MFEIETVHTGAPGLMGGGALLGSRVQVGRTAKALGRIQQSAIVRAAAVQAEAYVTTEKIHGLTRLGREALVDEVMLAHTRNAMAGSDPLLADELRLITDTVRLGHAELIAHTLSTYCREG